MTRCSCISRVILSVAFCFLFLTLVVSSWGQEVSRISQNDPAEKELVIFLKRSMQEPILKIVTPPGKYLSNIYYFYEDNEYFPEPIFITEGEDPELSIYNEIARRRARISINVFLQPESRNPCSDEENIQPVLKRNMGLVLSGGVSKGVAFVGALKYLEEQGLDYGMIAGTSMGAVIGALYSAGYDADQILYFLVEDVDWASIFDDFPNIQALSYNQQDIWGVIKQNEFIPRVNKGGLKSGYNIYQFLNEKLLPAMAMSGNCFNRLYIPFRAIVTDVKGAKSKPLKEGNLANGVKASLSFPVMFAPAFIEGVQYRDGGIIRNYPLSELAGDPNNSLLPTYIIGIDVSEREFHEKPDITWSWWKKILRTLQITTLYDSIEGVGQSFGAAIRRFTRQERENPNLKDCRNQGDKRRSCLYYDINIELTGGFFDFKIRKIKEMIIEGYKTTKRMVETLGLDKKAYISVSDTAINDLTNLLPQFSVSEIIKSNKNREPAQECAEAPKLGDNTLLGLTVKIPFDRDCPVKIFYEKDTRESVLKEIAFSDQCKENLDCLENELVGKLSGKIDRMIQTFTSFMSAKEITGEELYRKVREIFEDLTFSTLDIVFRKDYIRIDLHGWQYRFAGLEVLTNLTEGESLDRGSLMHISKKNREELEKIKQTKEDMLREFYLAQDKTVREKDRETPRLQLSEEEFSDSGGHHRFKLLLSRKTSPRLHSDQDGWNIELFDMLSYSGSRKPDDVYPIYPYYDPYYLRHEQKKISKKLQEELQSRRENISLSSLLSRSVDRYYSLGKFESIRLEKLEKDLVSLSAQEKQSHTASYLNYQYDRHNKHIWHFKNSTYWNRLTALLDVSTLNPVSGPGKEDGFWTDLNFVWQPYLLSDLDLSFHPYYAKRVENGLLIREGADPSFQFSFNEWGETLSLGEISSGLFLGITYKEINDLDTKDVIALEAFPALTAEPNATKKNIVLFIGVRQLRFSDESLVTFLERFEYLRTLDDGEHYGKMVIEGNFKQKEVEFIKPLFNLEQKLIFGAARKFSDKELPFYEWFSLGGYFPFTDRKLRGINTYDFIGSGRIERFGKYLYLIELNFKRIIYDAFKILNKDFEISLNPVISMGNIGNKFSELDDRFLFGGGAGVTLSLPIISTLQLRANLAIGTQRPFNDFAWYSSVDLIL